MNLNIMKLFIETDDKLPASAAAKIRGYLGNIFWEDSYAHQHDETGKFIYRYPRVQYKTLNGDCLLISFDEGREMTAKVFNNITSVNIGGLKEIISKGIEDYSAPFGVSNEHLSYSFLTPWLALNEKNYEKYQRLGAWPGKKDLLESILIGNIISMSKSLGYTVPEQIKANIGNMKEVPTKLKGTPMLGFLGTFSVNFSIPDYWGIGKSVSRGFGTVKRTVIELIESRS
jgi:hypothetical protein